MNKLFAPAAALMSRLKFRQRFSLITILFILPLALVLYILMARIGGDVSSAQREMAGTAYLRPAQSLLRHAITDWLLSQTAQRGLDTNNGALSENAASIEADFQALMAADSAHGASLGPQVGDAIRLAASSWANLNALPHTIDREVEYRPFLMLVRSLIATIGDRSGLVLDNALDTHYTIRALAVDIPQMQTAIADLAVIGDEVVGSRGMTEDEKATLNVLSSQIVELYDSMKRDAEVAYSNNPAGNLRPRVEPRLVEAWQAASALVDRLINEVLTPPIITLTLERWMEGATGALDASQKQWETQVVELDNLLAARIAAAEGTRNLALGLTAGVLLLVIYMWAGFYMAMMKTVAGLERASLMLTSRSAVVAPEAIDLGSRDEFSKRVAATLSQMASGMNQMSTTIQARTSELTQVSVLLAYLHDGVIIAGTDGIIKVLNPAAVRLLGTGFDNAVGKPIYNFVLDPRFQEAMAAAVDAPRQRHLVDVALNNRIITVSITFAPTVEGVCEGMLVLQDTTELRTLQHLSRKPLVSSE